MLDSSKSLSRRFLGLELGGSRRTSVVCLDYSRAERQVFLAEVKAHLHGTREQTADEAVILCVNALAPDLIGVDAPLTLPPCSPCDEADCAGASACPKESVRWMREEAERRGWSKARFPSPYTHRPVDLLLRGRWQDEAPFPIPAEEAFGSGRAPLAARMRYLRRHFSCRSLLEVSPRFALAGIASWYGISQRELRRCRDVQHGAENRFTILSKIAARNDERAQVPHVFLYMTDVVALAKDLSSFDALLCALMALCQDLSLLEEPQIDPGWGYVARPRSLRGLRRAEGARRLS